MTTSEPPEAPESARPRRNSLVLWTVGVLTLFALVTTSIRPSKPDVVEPAVRTFDLSRQPTIGDPRARVNVLVFADFKCPFCRRFELEVLPRLREDFVETGQARVTFVNHAFLGEDSVTAAIAGECVAAQNSALFWRYATTVYKAQGDETTRWATPDLLVRLATDVPGIDMARLRRCVETSQTMERLEEDRRLVREAHVRGTPTVIVNDLRLGRNDYRSVARAIREAQE